MSEDTVTLTRLQDSTLKVIVILFMPFGTWGMIDVAWRIYAGVWGSCK